MTDDTMNQKRNQYGVFLLAGCLFGIFIGMFAAPDKGATTRSGLMFRIKSCKNKLQWLMAKLMRSKNTQSNEAKEMGKDVVADLLHAAEKIVEELDDLEKKLDA